MYQRSSSKTVRPRPSAAQRPSRKPGFSCHRRARRRDGARAARPTRRSGDLRHRHARDVGLRSLPPHQVVAARAGPGHAALDAQRADGHHSRSRVRRRQLPDQTLSARPARCTHPHDLAESQVAQRRRSSALEISFLGKRFTITSEKEQILDLLISTFEDTVKRTASCSATAPSWRRRRSSSKSTRTRSRAACALSEEKFRGFLTASPTR